MQSVGGGYEPDCWPRTLRFMEALQIPVDRAPIVDTTAPFDAARLPAMESAVNAYLGALGAAIDILGYSDPNMPEAQLAREELKAYVDSVSN
jgi:hypothetical protein